MPTRIGLAFAVLRRQSAHVRAQWGWHEFRGARVRQWRRALRAATRTPQRHRQFNSLRMVRREWRTGCVAAWGLERGTLTTSIRFCNHRHPLPLSARLTVQRSGRCGTVVTIWLTYFLQVAFNLNFNTCNKLHYCSQFIMHCLLTPRHRRE